MKSLTAKSLLLYVLLMLSILPPPSSAQDKESQAFFNRANEAYSSGDFLTASEFYQDLTEEKGYGPGVLFNLANSYAQLGMVGEAILNYERALRLSPTDSDIRGNLELIKKENGLFPKEYSWSERFLRLLDLNQWTFSALVFLLIFSLLHLLSLKMTNSVLLRRFIQVCCMLLFLLSTVGAISRHHQWQPSVVINSDSRLLLSPFSAAASTGAIQEGRLIYPEKHHGIFTYITDETGRKGWIATAAIKPVLGKI